MRMPGNEIPHLWIVVSDVDPKTDKCAIVNVTTLGHICDKTVILNSGDHPFITHDSIVRYQGAMITTSKALEAGIAGGVAHHKAPCSARMLSKVIAGIGASKDTPIDVQVFCGFAVKSTIAVKAENPTAPPAKTASVNKGKKS